MIDGIRVEPLKVIADNRGKVMHMMKCTSDFYSKFGEIYFSFVNPGIIKGWKKHLQMQQNFSVPLGNIKFVFYDDRVGSNTRGQTQELLIGEQNYCLLQIPPNVWYSWSPCGQQTAMIASLTDLPHDPQESVSCEINNQAIPHRWQTLGQETVTAKLPKVSVIMNCYNSDKFLKEAIDSVYAQNFTDWEIIFWDNASTDKSAEIAKQYDSRLRYFHSEINLPLGEARNKAIEVARGEYIAFLDCDDLWKIKKIENQTSFLNNNQIYAFVYTNTIKFSDKDQMLDFADGDTTPSGQIFKDLLKRNFITLSSVMCRRSAFYTLQTIFDTRFQISEDWDLWLRLSYYFPVGYLSEPLTEWRINQNSLTHRNFIRYSAETEMIIENLKKIDSKAEQVYRDELKSLYILSIYYLGLGLWFQNNKIKSRQTLKPFIFNKRKFFLVYLATFLSNNSIGYFEKIYFKFRINRFL